MPFKIGDRVICIAPYDGNDEIVGLTGTVCGRITSTWCGVQYDFPLTSGHSCSGNCDSPYGWETAFACLEHYVEEPPAVIAMSYEELNI